MLSAEQILDGDLLRAFVVFAEKKNFTHAAEVIGLSQPAFFERIKKLSERVGQPLYTRTSGEIELTEAGTRLVAFARSSLERSEGLLASLRGAGRHTSVRLAAGEGAYLYVLTDALRAFAKTERTRLELLQRGGPACARAVESGEAHLGVGVFDIPPRGLQVRTIVETPMCAAVPVRHRLARRPELRLSDLADERMILAPSGRRQRDLVGRAFADAGERLEDPLEADGWALMLAFVAARLGVAIVNGVCCPPKGVVLRPVPELGTVAYRLLSRPKPSEAAERLATLILGTCR